MDNSRRVFDDGRRRGGRGGLGPGTASSAEASPLTEKEAGADRFSLPIATFSRAVRVSDGIRRTDGEAKYGEITMLDFPKLPELQA